MSDPEKAEYWKLADDEQFDASNAERKELKKKQQLIRAQQWTLDPEQRKVKIIGQTIDLTFVEFEIFRLLSGRPYWAFTPNQIIEAIEPGKFRIDTKQVDTHIETLRNKLGMFSDYIQSVPGIGYRFKE